LNAAQLVRDGNNGPCTYIIARRVLGRRRLNGVGEEAEDGADPQQNREATEHLLAELDPLRRCLWRSQLVRTVLRENLVRALNAQALVDSNFHDAQRKLLRVYRVAQKVSRYRIINES